MANQRPPAWFRLSSMVNRPLAPTPVDPTPHPPPIYARPPPLPIPALVRPSFPIRPNHAPTQTQEPIPPQPPLATSSLPLPAVAPPRPSVSTPVGSPIPSTPPTPVRQMSPVLSPVSSPSPPKSPVLPPASIVAPPQSLVSESTMAAAPPAGTASPPRARSATPPPTSMTPPPNSTSPVTYKKFPSSIRTKPEIPMSSRPNSPVSPKGYLPRTRAATPPPSAMSPPPKSFSPVTYKNSPSSIRTKINTPVSSGPNSPIPKHVSTVSSTDIVNGSPVSTVSSTDIVNGSPVSNPKEMKPLERSPERSPIIKPLSRSPSPLTLPPAQLNTNSEHEANVEQKTVLLEETTGKPMKMSNPHYNASYSNEKKEPVNHNKGTTKKINNPHELGTTVITLAGENKGAVMELSPSQRKKYSMGNPHILKSTKTGSSSGDKSSSESGEEEIYRNKEKNKMTMKMQPMTQYLNSNVQGVNNSVLNNFTFAQNDPGVHLSLNRKANSSQHME